MKLANFYKSWCIPHIVVLEFLLIYVHCPGKDDIKKGWQTCGERMGIGLRTQLRTWPEKKREGYFLCNDMYVQVQEQLCGDGKWQTTAAKLPVRDVEFQG